MQLKPIIALNMPDDILDKIKYLCKAISKVEWSGVLFYDIQGSIQDPENFKVILKDILPMNKGSQAYTEYDLDNRYVDYLMDNPEAMDWKVGHIHSHNTMDVFFSGTDMSELQDNSAAHNFYLSLIVNNYMDFQAKIAFRGTVDVKTETLPYYALNENGDKYIIEESVFTVKKEKLFILDCSVESKADILSVKETFSSKVAGIIKAAIPKYPVHKINPKSPATVVKGFQGNKYLNQFPPKSGSNKHLGKIPFESEIEDDIPFYPGNDLTGIEKFVICLIQGTNPVGDFVVSVEEVLEDLESITIDNKNFSAELAQSVLNNYAALYNKHFPHEDESTFICVTNEVIEILEDNKMFFTFLTNSISVLTQMLNKFIKKDARTSNS